MLIKHTVSVIRHYQAGRDEKCTADCQRDTRRGLQQPLIQLTSLAAQQSVASVDQQRASRSDNTHEILTVCTNVTESIR